METILDEELPRSRLAVLLKHFSQIEDGRESWRPSGGNAAAWDLRKIADCDDFDEKTLQRTRENGPPRVYSPRPWKMLRGAIHSKQHRQGQN
jgi:hypothetical protein